MASSEPTNRERENIAFGRQIDWKTEAQLGTVFFGPEKARTFPPLPIGTIQELIDQGYLDPTSRHNDAPPAGDLLAWASNIQETHLAYQFEIGLIGYMVGPRRDDSRVELEGISVQSPGPIPDDLKAQVVRDFSPDLLTVDDFRIEIRWD